MIGYKWFQKGQAGQSEPEDILTLMLRLCWVSAPQRCEGMVVGSLLYMDLDHKLAPDTAL